MNSMEDEVRYYRPDESLQTAAEYFTYLSL